MLIRLRNTLGMKMSGKKRGWSGLSYLIIARSQSGQPDVRVRRNSSEILEQDVFLFKRIYFIFITNKIKIRIMSIQFYFMFKNVLGR